MKPERWNQVDELLEAALDCPAAERASFLDRACLEGLHPNAVDASALHASAVAARAIHSTP
jgi:hypothetical protein